MLRLLGGSICQCIVLLLLVAGYSGTHALTASQTAARSWMKGFAKSGPEFHWPTQQLMRGITYVGQAERLRSVVRKLVEGKEALNMVALGGSITYGVGVKNQTEAFPDLLKDWMRKAFPGPEHEMHNGAVRGTTSTYMALCLELHLPPGDLDIVLIEYAINDTPRPSPSMAPGSRRAALERLLRKVLNAPGQPAIIMVNMLAIHRDMEMGYWVNAERDFQEFSTYYGLPTVSFKAAAYHEMKSGDVTGSNVSSFFGPKTAAVHPEQGGHLFAAELVGQMVQQMVSDSATGVWENESAPESSYVIPPPMITNNYEAKSSLCLMETKFQAVVTASSDWNYTNENLGPGKWGYVSTTVGAKLTIEVDTRAPTSRNYKGKIWLSVAYLKSFHKMGKANITCVSGCECEPLHIDGICKDREVSLTYMASMAVTQHAKCTVEVAIVPKAASSSGNKFKVMGVTVSAEEDVKTKEGVLKYIRDSSLHLGGKKTRAEQEEAV